MEAKTFSSAICKQDYRETGTEAHCRRVAAWTEELCRATKRTRDEANALAEAAKAHHYPDVMSGTTMARICKDLGVRPPDQVESSEELAHMILAQFRGFSQGNKRVVELSMILEAANLIDEELEYAPFADALVGGTGKEHQHLSALMQKLRLANLRHLDEIIPRLPVYPVAATQLYRLLCSDEFDLAAAAQAASRDQVIAGKLINAANSAFYHPRERINSLERAILYIGTNDARRLLLATSIQPLFSAPKLKMLWEHAVYAAQVAERIAVATGGRVDSAEAFLSGLLHDVGKLAIAQLPAGVIKAIDRLVSRGCQPAAVETVVCGFDHAAAGEHVLRHWNFTDEIVQAIRHHHQPERTTSRLASVLYLTEFWTDSEEDLPSQARLTVALEQLGLTAEELDQLLAEEQGALKVLSDA
ncbi:MAG TPA: HDOD domain-containing protein [Bryobacteraceae bacterium]|nr:HDOD domain-containing protein [Bryobacteraceae bacterium]